MAATQEVMAESSRIVLGGFCLRTDAKIVRYLDRYMDARGQQFWDQVMQILRELEQVYHGRTPE